MTPAEGKDTIWSDDADLRVESLNALLKGNMGEQIGIEIVEVGPAHIVATMPVDHRTRQPFGLLHGGASVALAETLGSLAASLTLAFSDEAAVGLEINANHVRGIRNGTVRGRVDPIHLGRTTQVWQIRVSGPDGRLISIARLTVAIIRGVE